MHECVDQIVPVRHTGKGFIPAEGTGRRPGDCASGLTCAETDSRHCVTGAGGLSLEILSSTGGGGAVPFSSGALSFPPEF